MTIQQRIDRIKSTTHIVRIEDSTIYVVTGFEVLGDTVFVDASGGVLFQDLDVFTLEEAAGAERFLNKIKKLLKIK